MRNENDMHGEVDAVGELPKELEPSSGLENRIVRELVECGVLREQAQPVIELTHWRLAGVAAACLVLITCGFGLGFIVSTRSAHANPMQRPTDGIGLAVAVQGAGSEYIAALEDLAYFSGALDESEFSQGREVALATLRSATSAVAQMLLREDVLRDLVSAVLEPGVGGSSGISELRTVSF